MKKILLALLLAPVLCSAQSLKKYPLSTSGCSAYMFCDPGTIELTYSPDSSKVYTAECKTDDVTYDIIVVKMKERIPDIGAAEEVLQQYMDFLKSSFEVAKWIGYGKGHRLKGNEKIHGMIDYWEDKSKNNIKVKGWTDGIYISVFIALSAKELPETRVNLFLDGIVFPGM